MKKLNGYIIAIVVLVAIIITLLVVRNHEKVSYETSLQAYYDSALVHQRLVSMSKEEAAKWKLAYQSQYNAVDSLLHTYNNLTPNQRVALRSAALSQLKLLE